MKINSRSKGRRGEREVAALLERWWAQIEPGTRFKPTPLSGGWSTPDVRAAFQVSGDLVTTAETFPYCVEVKRREKWNLDKFILSYKGPLANWWEQAVCAASENKKIPLLVFRRSREEWYAMMPLSEILRAGVERYTVCDCAPVPSPVVFKFVDLLK